MRSSHFFLHSREAKRVVGRVIPTQWPKPLRYYATIGETVQGAFCTLSCDSPHAAIREGRTLSDIAMGG